MCVLTTGEHGCVWHVCNDNGGWQITLTHIVPGLDPALIKNVGPLNILIKLNRTIPTQASTMSYVHLKTNKAIFYRVDIKYMSFLCHRGPACWLSLFLKSIWNFDGHVLKEKALKPQCRDVLKQRSLRFCLFLVVNNSPAVSVLR